MTDVVQRSGRPSRAAAAVRQPEPASAVARRALDLVGENPAAAMALADEALGLARRQHDGSATTTALRAQGLAARATGALAVAEEKLRRAVRLALRRDDAHSAAEARMTLSFVLLDAGQVRAALRQSALASTVLEGVEGARLLAQHGLILQRCGRTAEALSAFACSLPRLQAAGDDVWMARVLGNRGIMRAYLGDLEDAATDLHWARDIQRRAGKDVDAAASTWNLGFVAARRGDAVAALSLFDEADHLLSENGVAVAQRSMDRADVLLSVGMASEAHQHVLDALHELERTGQGADLVECRLLLARAALLDARPADAAAAARSARRRAASQERHAWALLARHLELRALDASGHHGVSLVRRAQDVADELERSRWTEAATEARLTAARIAVHLGKPAKAAALLTQVLRSPGRNSDEFRVQRAYAQALLRKQEGDCRGSLRAAQSALSVIQRRRSTVAATDLQLGVMSSGLQIAQLAVEMAVAANSPSAAMSTLEIWRAQNIRARPVRPPKDAMESRALDQLRRATADVMTARLAGDDVTTLEARRQRSEREVIERSRRVRPSGVHDPGEVRRPSEWRAALDAATLVEIFALGDTLGAVTLRGSGLRGPASALTELGSLRECLRELDHLQFALARLASGRGSESMLAAARRSAEEGARHLDAVLLGAIRGQLGDGPLVLVPSDGLHAVPWGVLPTCSGRPTHIVPSATAWLRARERFRSDAGPGTAGSVAVVTGPGLEHAEREAAAIAHSRRTIEMHVGPRATVAAALSALRGAQVAHIAAHGRFESDNPMMSSLQLADGPLMLYDLEDLDPPPLQVVLAACHSAVARLHAGHELLGLAHALLWFGSSGVVATSLPAPDAETAVLMGGLHAGLARGQGVAEALWNARQHVDPSTPAGYATSAGFQAYGY